MTTRSGHSLGQGNGRRGRETYSFYFSSGLFVGRERKRESSHSDSQDQTNFLCASDGL